VRLARRARCRVVLPGVALVIAAAMPAQAQDRRLGPDGARAFQMARSADDAARVAREEGEAILREIQKLEAPDPAAATLATVHTDAASAHRALLGHAKLAQASAAEALQLLADSQRVLAGKTDPIRRDVMEQRALLAAHEAALMAARARTEAERLRALHAEGRVVIATRPAPDPAPAASPRPAQPRSPVATPGATAVAVPNLVGARLEAARRDLAEAGLRLGQVTGPADGFVVKQTPEAGAPAPRDAPVHVTLSATAAGVTAPPSQ
jgi:hypothetical protein